jgi:hypothetical protein
MTPYELACAIYDRDGKAGVDDQGIIDNILAALEKHENAWRETVRDIYDRLYSGSDNYFSTNNRLAGELIGMIENRHPGFFGAPAEK